MIVTQIGHKEKKKKTVFPFSFSTICPFTIRSQLGASDLNRTWNPELQIIRHKQPKPIWLDLKCYNVTRSTCTLGFLERSWCAKGNDITRCRVLDFIFCLCLFLTCFVFPSNTQRTSKNLKWSVPIDVGIPTSFTKPFLWQVRTAWTFIFSKLSWIDRERRNATWLMFSAHECASFNMTRPPPGKGYLWQKHVPAAKSFCATRFPSFWHPKWATHSCVSVIFVLGHTQSFSDRKKS